VKALLTRFAGFSGLPILAMASPLLVLPFLARAGGTEGWIAVNLGLAIGYVCASITQAGWSSLGPALVASEKDEHRRVALYTESVWTRLSVWGVAMPVSAALAGILAGGTYWTTAVLLCMVTSLNALTMSWFAVGTGRPSQTAIFESVPKLLGSIISLAPVILWGALWAYPVILGTAQVLGLLAFNRRLTGSALPPRLSRVVVGQRLRKNVSAWGVEVIGSSCSNAPVPLASVTLPARDVASLASADKVYRYALVVIIVTGNALQGWVLEARGHSRRRRQRLAVGVHVIIGAAGCLCLATLGPWLTAVLFGSDVAASREVMTWLGVAFFMIAVSTPFIRNVLMPTGNARVVLRATIVGSVLGIATMIALVGPWGATGIAAGVAISETCIVIACALSSIGIRVDPSSDHAAH